MQFDVRYASPARAVASSIGLTLTGIDAAARRARRRCDDRRARQRRQRCVRERHARRDGRARRGGDRRVARTRVRASHTLVTICSGALLAARAGLLDGHDCTTHFSVCGELASLAPRARVLENRLYVADGQRCSSAGVTAGTDLMLHLVATLCSPAVALAVARHLVVYLRRSGSRPAAFAVARRTQPHSSGRASRAGCDRGRSFARVDARGARAHREHEPAASVAPVQRARRHGPAGIHQPPARLARARADRTDAARHGARRRTQRLRLGAPAPARVAPLVRDAAARVARGIAQ